MSTLTLRLGRIWRGNDLKLKLRPNGGRYKADIVLRCIWKSYGGGLLVPQRWTLMLNYGGRLATRPYLSVGRIEPIIRELHLNQQRFHFQHNAFHLVTQFVGFLLFL